MDKPCVEVIAHFNLNGDVIPLKIRINDENEEKVYTVNKIKKPVKGASLKIGVQGDRYSCVIDGKRANLYRNFDNKWFIELV